MGGGSWLLLPADAALAVKCSFCEEEAHGKCSWPVEAYVEAEVSELKVGDQVRRWQEREGRERWFAQVMSVSNLDAQPMDRALGPEHGVVRMKFWGQREDRAIRYAAKALGVEIKIRWGPNGAEGLTVDDPELDFHFSRSIGPPSRYVAQIQTFHEHIYHERAREKHRQQGGLCAHCGRPLGGRGECDHIKSRARGQRDDRLSNLRIVCPPMTGGCSFHQDRHSKGKA